MKYLGVGIKSGALDTLDNSPDLELNHILTKRDVKVQLLIFVYIACDADPRILRRRSRRRVRGEKRKVEGGTNV